MAKRKVKKIPKEPKLQLASETIREIIAVILITVSIFMILSMLGFAGTLGNWIFGAIKLFIGAAGYFLPLALLIVSWILFQPSRYDFKTNNLLGLLSFFVFFAALLHLILAPASGMTIGSVGNYGGLIGFGLSSLMLPFLNRPVSIFIISALILISLLIAANARIKEFGRKFLAIFTGGRPKEDLTIHEPAFNINNKLPIKGTVNVGDKRDDEVLKSSVDHDWIYPPLDLLEATTTKADAGNVKERAAAIQNTLADLGIEVSMADVNIGPTVSQYSLKPANGVKLNKITPLDRDLALALAAHPIRIEAPIPGKSLVGIEVPNKQSASVRLKDILASREMKEHKSKLTFALGRDVSGEVVAADLGKMPHLLIAGATGSGKSVMINALISTLLYRNSPSELKLIMVDPKRVEMTPYNDIPHLLTPVIVEADKTISALKWAIAEVERRYRLFADKGNKGIIDYNFKASEGGLPYIVVVIDELADLMMVAAKDVEALIVRLAQMGRAAGIHLVLATQRPDVNVITGLIKANIPARIALKSSSQVDSRTILDQAGAEKLLGNGDMLFQSPEIAKPRRVQGVYISAKEIEVVTNFLRKARPPVYNEEVLAQSVKINGRAVGGDYETADDDLFDEAAKVVIQSKKASASLLQRRLRVGYSRAARLIDLLEERGVVGPPDGARPREVLVSQVTDLGGEGDYSGE